MRLATWNVNSIRTRLPRVLDWLATHQPDVLTLQELKVTDELFPADPLREAGYHAVCHGQKTWNGVAILSKTPPEDVRNGLNGDPDDPQARLVGATVNGVRILSAYVPNGSVVGSDKWAYKLRWLDRLRAHLDENYSPSQPVALTGDLNVAVDDADIANPDSWNDTVLTHPEARAALRRVTEWGLEDAFRKIHPDGGIYSWWDYRRGAFHKDDGLRIDHVLATPTLAQAATCAWADRDERKTAPKDDPRGKPSDHAPLVVEFDL
jgi:exodeoxyribonuclease-3